MYGNIDQITSIINGLSGQQKVLSNNVANAHTPGYVRQTYSFSDVLGNLNNPFENDLSRKMGSTGPSASSEGEGGVDIAHEMIEMQKVFLNYSMVTRRASTVFSNIRRASQIGK